MKKRYNGSNYAGQNSNAAFMGHDNGKGATQPWKAPAPAVRHARGLSYEDRADLYESGIDFADPGGRSALRAESRSNPRNLPCPTCGRKNVLTPADRARHYQCDACADRAEGRGGYSDY